MYIYAYLPTFIIYIAYSDSPPLPKRNLLIESCNFLGRMRHEARRKRSTILTVYITSATSIITFIISTCTSITSDQNIHD